MLTVLGVVAAFLAQSPPEFPVAVRYEISASVDPARVHLSVRARLTIDRSLPGFPDSVRIELGGGRIGGLRLTGGPVTAGGATPRALGADSSGFWLPLPHAGTTTVALDYRVTLDTTRRRQLGYDLLPSTELADTWYPRLSGLPDSVTRFSDFEVTLDLPALLALITSGAAIDSTSEPGLIRRRFHGRHLEGFALAMADDRYLVRSVKAEGITARVLSPRSDTLTWDRAGRETVRAAAWYRAQYGFFPLHTIGIVPGSRGARGGFPLSGVFMIHQGDLSPGFVRWITSHELAHYYWGLHVLSSAERLDWLMLGLGIWTDQWFLARTNRVSIESQWRDPQGDNSFERLAEARFSGIEQRLGIPEAEADSLPYDYNSLVRHAKGAVAVYLLSLRMGAENFAAFQRSLLEEFRYRALSPATFAARLEAAGVVGSTAFLDRWVRNDASLDYAVRGVRKDTTAAAAGYWLDIERTGTVPYPVTIEVRSAAGMPVRLEVSGQETDTSLRVALASPPREILIDPDGRLPMWSSANREMRAAFLRALGTAGPVEMFLVLAGTHLDGGPDPQLGATVVERLFEVGRFQEIGQLAGRRPWVTQCIDRTTCVAALQVARAWWRLGRPQPARLLLGKTSVLMNEMGLGGIRRLATAQAELGGGTQ